MAMKECLECKESVSEDAEVCPGCGKKNPTETIGDKIGQFVTGVVLFILIMWWSPWNSNDKKEVQKSPIKIKTEQAYNTVYNYFYPKVIITSLVDNIQVKDVITNKGNCSPTFTEETHKTLKYGQSMEIRYKRCDVMKIKVITDKGNWSFKF